MNSKTPVFLQSKQQVKNNFVNQQKFQQQCPIFLDNPTDIATICNHKFCKVCISRILKVRNNCPMCRKFNPLIEDISEQDLKNQPSQQEWNLEVARQIVFKKLGNGTEQVQIVNTDGSMEETNIFVGKGAQINVSPGANIIINVQSPMMFYIRIESVIQLITINIIITAYKKEQRMQQPQPQQNSQQPLPPPSVNYRSLRHIKSQQYLPIISTVQDGRQLEKGSQFTNRLSQFRQLTKEKCKLIDQLNCLKEDAVAALKEKEEIIDRLRFQYERNVEGEGEREQVCRELSRCMRRMKQLQEQRDQISAKYQKQRIYFFQQLYTKQQTIDDQSHTLSTQSTLITNLQTQAQTLQLHLHSSQTKIHRLQKQLQTLKQEITQFYNSIQLCKQCQNKLSKSTFNTTNSWNKMGVSALRLTNDDIQRERDLVRLEYEEEINGVVEFYQRQIGILRAFLDADMQHYVGSYKDVLPRTLQTQIYSDQDQNQSLHQQLSISYKKSQKASLRNAQTHILTRHRHNKSSNIEKEQKNLIYQNNSNSNTITSNFGFSSILKHQLQGIKMQHIEFKSEDSRCAMVEDSLGSTRKKIWGEDNCGSFPVTANRIYIQEQDIAIAEEVEEDKQEETKIEAVHNVSQRIMPTKREICWGLGGLTLGALVALGLCRVLQRNQS